ncbi:MAG TPA: response regulator transcription factor [Alphaproteobacteria bacterium]|nr:response regulator transcription factor [Alphaproteobacteria bacterium]
MQEVLLADDHAVLVDGLRGLLRERNPSLKVYVAYDLEGALTLARKNPFIDLALLDYSMPGMFGLAGLQRFRDAFPETPCALLTGHYEPGLAAQALQIGACGFLSKSMPFAELLPILDDLAAGGIHMPEIAEDGAAGPAKPPLATLEPWQAGLTGREQQVVSCLAEGLTNKEIARRLGMEPSTVKHHLSSVFRKMGVSNRMQAMRLVGQLSQGVA